MLGIRRLETGKWVVVGIVVEVVAEVQERATVNLVRER